ncbi:BZ3500_MvSof-1268-A1-R1_Chr5-2g07824 [Microbotryum saponariae]|uniref:BZ3500_MvSof-1268-A1-R1_Chr5-2g07824 protein n=1 Tax=Microbotryum saponariae TaxID=289078 RepID=A0A2X0M1D8_9BASI|nr:BZ3500_MvSof-1268-A1-R1_Chr5-2g07824 [Microbotryum saponariae]SDA05693.1 BZ3501_MvSof-1269-A2-R1_Chr5-2g07646 [Microbotryum saponariae]
MPLPDESSRPSASSLIKRFEAISASQDSSSASAMNRSVSGGAPKRIWSNPSATTAPATSAVAPSLAVDTRTSISIDTSKPLPEPPTASDEATPNVEPELASTTLPEARFASSPGAKNPPSPTSQAPAESTTILFSGPSPTTPMRNFPPPIITQSSLDVDGPPVGAVPGSANGLLASSPPNPTSLTELVAGGSKHHSKSPSVDSTSSRVSHEGLSQPTSPRVDEQRLSAPPLRGEASPPPCDSEDSPQEKKFTFPAVESKEQEVAAESPAIDGSAPIKERLKVKSTSSSTSNARTKSTSPPIRRTVSPTVPTVPIVPKSRPSLTSPTASSLAKSRLSTDKSPPLSPKISPRTTNATLPKTTMTVGGVGAPRSSSSASLISRSGAPSPTPSTASRSSALEGTTRSRSSRATTPSTPSRSPPMTRKGTGSGTTTTTTTTTSSTLKTPARNTPRTPSASTPLRSSTPSKFSSRGSSAPISKTSPEGKKIPTRVGNVKMASRGRIGLAGAPAGPNPSPRGAKKVEQRTETPKTTVEDTQTEKEDEVEAPRHEDIPDIPSDEEERVFDPMTLQGGRPAPGRIGIPMDVETGRAVGDEQLKAAQG